MWRSRSVGVKNTYKDDGALNLLMAAAVFGQHMSSIVHTAFDTYSYSLRYVRGRCSVFVSSRICSTVWCVHVCRRSITGMVYVERPVGVENMCKCKDDGVLGLSMAAAVFGQF